VRFLNRRSALCRKSSASVVSYSDTASAPGGLETIMHSSQFVPNCIWMILQPRASFLTLLPADQIGSLVQIGTRIR